MVKNVTGYDLCKLFAGSWGTLAAMTDVTIKVLPKPETEATVIVAGLDDARACAAMSAAMGSPYDVSGAAHLPDHVASWFDGLPKAEASHRAAPGRPRALGRASQGDAEGADGAVRVRRNPRRGGIRARSGIACARSSRSPPTAARARPLWRISVPPARGHELSAVITPAAQMFYDWAGGLVWVAMPYAEEPDAAAVRGAVAEIGGHATLIRAPAAVRATTEVFAPEPPALAAVAKRVKESFDPKGLLNPGRMWAGV